MKKKEHIEILERAVKKMASDIFFRTLPVVLKTTKNLTPEKVRRYYLERAALDIKYKCAPGEELT